MITEDYCSSEVAKLLDKKGFREYCEAIYFILENGDYRWSKIDIPIRDCSTCKPTAILCPTHQMVMKWLREKRIYIEITSTFASGFRFRPNIYDYNKYHHEGLKEVTTYEEAVEAAIKYSLENLI